MQHMPHVPHTVKRLTKMKPASLCQCKAEHALCNLEDESIDLVVADPPYDIAVGGVAWDCVRNYMKFAKEWLTEAVRVLRPGGALMLYGSPCRVWIPRMTLMLVDELGMNHVQDLPWVYRQGGDSRMETMKEYAVRHERLVWFEKPPTEHKRRTFNPLEAAEHYTEEDRAVALAKGKGRVTEKALDRGRPPRTFIDIPRENSRSKERQYGKHPSMKPMPLCERLIKVHSNVDDCVLVPFAGSGSEILAATKLGRQVIGFELEREYIELMQRRFQGHGVPLQMIDTTGHATDG
jgi:site-specific DNA-methyltransferase (adenine-specific)